MIEAETYHIIDRVQWRDYRERVHPSIEIHLTEKQLRKIISLNDELSVTDAMEVYEPLTQLIAIYRDNYSRLQRRRNHFLGIEAEIPPFMIAISGSVAVGKSTTARLLRLFLSQAFPDLNVDLVTTDGFLYPNEELIKRGILNRKGFPESYDMPKLLQFLTDVKNNKRNIAFPVYSHENYDIVEGAKQILKNPNILIVEGINVLQLDDKEQVFVGDFADLSIYVDADTTCIERWYYERFKMLMHKAAENPDNHHYRYSQMAEDQAMAEAKRIWQEINLVNLNEYILPTRNRADMVIHKRDNHYIDQLWMKKY
ncbi:type I pantothenate kinase [Aerococcus sanguinicola]|uniref:type I pantothenate kinase n=1 Tax=unclassified Aerococcus TaxID=2618060 RepID=UPI0008A5C2BE|nr:MULTISPECIES: type I pantothenate kinase [unclassified Aerococcus]KAB0646813.1 type I pantothenate kinase [Aerococcus sanguinicola]MDK6234116.1 type I pantothenate kinase [Aerococcus sp. UMB10185]MDK6804369.1 type I pantothenate kinase [Aerococcus sp. UMB7834]MDK6855457.1 type I pantothenate kinase [Aerococcus sp. UMB7533]MDK8501635.1 type I pantothenate kinase [Aerococcus sp. UMB1112A]